MPSPPAPSTPSATGASGRWWTDRSCACGNSTLATLGVGHFTDRLPEGEPDATLYYSDTSVMRLWRYPLPRSQSGRWEGVFISFVTLEGTTYSYYTDRTDWQNFSWPLKVESNDPWGE